MRRRKNEENIKRRKFPLKFQLKTFQDKSPIGIHLKAKWEWNWINYLILLFRIRNVIKNNRNSSLTRRFHWMATPEAHHHFVVVSLNFQCEEESWNNRPIKRQVSPIVIRICHLSHIFHPLLLLSLPKGSGQMEWHFWTEGKRTENDHLATILLPEGNDDCIDRPGRLS